MSTTALPKKGALGFQRSDRGFELCAPATSSSRISTAACTGQWGLARQAVVRPRLLWSGGTSDRNWPGGAVRDRRVTGVFDPDDFRAGQRAEWSTLIDPRPSFASAGLRDRSGKDHGVDGHTGTTIEIVGDSTQLRREIGRVRSRQRFE
jgi:hypothetical protein